MPGQLDIAVWQVASANPREGLGGAGKDTPARLAHLSGDMCPTAPSSHLQPHPTGGRLPMEEGALASAQAQGGAFPGQGPEVTITFSPRQPPQALPQPHITTKWLSPLQIPGTGHFCSPFPVYPFHLYTSLLLGHKHIKWCKVSEAPACH